jgi:nitrate/nitrite transport system ATP-binding protein
MKPNPENAMPTTAMPSSRRREDFIAVEHVEMVFESARGRFHALRDINLRVTEGEFITLIGHSGCGKSTLLNLMAGLLVPSEGVLLCDNREINAPGPDRAVVFQNHSLLPWMTCEENVLLGVERVFGAAESRAQLKARAVEALSLVGLAAAQGKRPGEISGGMKQRVGIARALAMEPKVLLMDEPFGALDALTRAKLQDELMKIVKAKGSTVVMVTHDVDEAALLSDRIVMMTNGPAATIGEIQSVNLPPIRQAPRDRVAMSRDANYLAAREAVIEFLYNKQPHVEKAA